MFPDPLRVGGGLSQSWIRTHPILALAGIAASVALSLWALYIDDIINNDGVYYILTAEYIAAGEWSNALAVFKWPAYSYLIFLVQHLPGVDFETAARAVTTAGFTLAVLGFVSAVHALGGRGRILYLAMVVALVYPGINESRAYLVRDALFLALYLFALAGLFRYVATHRARQLVLSAICLLLAALFRVEALMIALLLPALAALRETRGRTALATLVGYILVAVPALALFYGWWIFRPEDGDAAWMGLEEPWAVFGPAMDQVFAEFQGHLASAGLANDAAGVLSGVGLVAWLVVRETVEAVSVPFGLLLLVEAVRGRMFESFSRPQRRLIGWVIVLHLVALFVFAAAKFFLAPRYPVALATTLVLAVPFILDRYLRTVTGWPSRLRRGAAGAGLALLLLLNGFEGVDNFTDKHYLREAALWLREHAPPDYRLASNDLKLAYYAGRYREKWVVFRESDEFREFLVTDQWKWKDYVAVNLRRKEPELESLVMRNLAQEPIRRFESPNGDRLLVFYTGDD